MSDSPEKLILAFWESNLDSLLSADRVFNTAPDDDEESPPYAVIDVDIEQGPRTNTGGYRNGQLTLELFHENWKTGLDIVTAFYKTIQPLGAPMIVLKGSGIRLDNFRHESGGDTREPDGMRHFLHNYTFRIHDIEES